MTCWSQGELNILLFIFNIVVKVGFSDLKTISTKTLFLHAWLGSSASFLELKLKIPLKCLHSRESTRVHSPCSRYKKTPSDFVRKKTRVIRGSCRGAWCRPAIIGWTWQIQLVVHIYRDTNCLCLSRYLQLFYVTTLSQNMSVSLSVLLKIISYYVIQF